MALGVAQQSDDDLPFALFAVAVIAEGGQFIVDAFEIAAGAGVPVMSLSALVAPSPHLLTEMLHPPARNVGLIYLHRWSIELFFRGLKV